jgi:hypothetical protein
MTNLPAVRMNIVLLLLVAIGCASRPASAQLPPNHPISPTEPRKCQEFGNQVLVYTAEIMKQHEECLNANKVDRKETGPSPMCSHSACQYLHDRVYNDPIYSVSSLQKQIIECNEQLRDHMDELATRAKEEAQHKKEKADREAREQREQAESDARDQKRAAERTANDDAEERKEAAEKQAESDRIRSELSQLAAQAATHATSKVTESSNSSAGLADPFPNVNSAPRQTEAATNESMVDPFESKETLADPFSNSDRPHSEVTWDDAKAVFQGVIDKAADNLGAMLTSAKSNMSLEEFRRFEQTVGNAHSFLGGLSTTITAITFQRDVEKVVADPHKPDNWRDIVSDGASYGTSYVLKRLSPDFLSKLWEGPVGWSAAITLSSSSTQTAKQDFDPTTALNNPGQYNFQQREAALQSLYQSAQKHPEIWNQKRYEWLYGVSERLYNSPDNPSIHLTPP